MSATPLWPGGLRGALNLSFDNLGEAAELEMGALPADAPLGRHPTAIEVLPELLDRLATREIRATFFVEGLNAELYPELLREIGARGHEVGYHAWRHEQWANLTAAEQAESLARGRAAFERLGLQIAGLRPPGGLLGAGGVEVLREAGLRYCSPAGCEAGLEAGVALLPFRWRDVDASCVLPPLAAARKQMTGSSAAVEPASFVAALEQAIDDLAENGGYLAIVLHPFMLDWLDAGNLATLLDRVALASERDGIWVAPGAEVADHVLAHGERFAGGAVFDSTSWT
ncbi:MAG TPA: polysaccharide deacetylase family protein [Solirubrobacterales bacterium]|nr:polysaccharide deacetylase family protein [Solirubrobacterales bacterium]